MAVLQSRVVVKVKPGQWDEARRIARLQVDDANTRPATLAYQIYEDEPNSHLICIAAYRDDEAWLAHSKSNPHAKAYMETCEVVSIEVHGDPSAKLRGMIESFGSAVIYGPVP